MLKISLTKGNVLSPEVVTETEVGRFWPVVKHDAFGKTVKKRTTHGVHRKTDTQAEPLYPFYLGGHKASCPTGDDRETILLVDEGKGNGVVFEVSIYDITHGLEKSCGGIRSCEGQGDISLHEGAVTLLRLRLQPCGKPPCPGGGSC